MFKLSKRTLKTIIKEATNKIHENDKNLNKIINE